MDVASVTRSSTFTTKAGRCARGRCNISPAKFVFGEPGRTGMAINSVISAGCIVSGATGAQQRAIRCACQFSRRSGPTFVLTCGAALGYRRAISGDVQDLEGTVIGYDANEDRITW